MKPPIFFVIICIFEIENFQVSATLSEMIEGKYTLFKYRQTKNEKLYANRGDYPLRRN